MISKPRLPCFFLMVLCAAGSLILSACTNRPLVKGFFSEGGTIYRESEQEEWGARSTLKVKGLEF
jgi:hypothetical protein